MKQYENTDLTEPDEGILRINIQTLKLITHEVYNDFKMPFHDQLPSKNLNFKHQINIQVFI